MIWQPSFTHALIGGALIGTSASMLLVGTGRVAGISGIVAGFVASARTQLAWRVAFVAGLLAGGLIASRLVANVFPSTGALTAAKAALLVFAGVLVGIGTRIGDGCTSGHGVCGISRGSLRSFVATVTFISTGMLAVFLSHLLGAS